VFSPLCNGGAEQHRQSGETHERDDVPLSKHEHRKRAE
jgi:hypothetical protein